MALDGRIAFVNLSSAKVEEKTAPRRAREALLGGRGLAIHLLHHRMPPVAGPLAPEAVVVLGAGLLCGTPFPAAAAAHAVYRSPLSGYLGHASFAGHFGAGLRFAGFEQVVITGKAPALSILRIHDGAVSLLPCPDLAGAETAVTVPECRARVDDDDAEVLAVGPAGERDVRIADVRPAFGEGFGGAGLGAVLGSKNLKAVVVSGSGRVRIAAPMTAAASFAGRSRRLADSPAGRALARHGTAGFPAALDKTGALRLRHSRAAAPGQGAADPALFAQLSPAGASCFACPLACRRLVRPRAGQPDTVEAPGFEALCGFGPLLGVGDPAAVAELDRKARAFGLQPYETAAVLAWAAEAFERKALRSAQIEAAPPAFGDPVSLASWIERIGRAEGLGEVLGFGMRRAGETLGADVTALALAAKDLSLPPVHVAAFPAVALAAAVGSTGPALDGGAPCLEFDDLPAARIAAAFAGAASFEGSLEPGRRSRQDTARLVQAQQLLNMAADILGVCRLATPFTSADFLTLADMAEGLEEGTGIAPGAESLLRAAERALCLERMFNGRNGLTRKDDRLPPRAFEAGGRPALDEAELAALTDEYYALMGLDGNGAPTEARRKALGMEDGLPSWL